MDSLDVKILRELRGGVSALTPFPSSVNSLRQVADKLRVDKETIRNRLSKLSESGVFLGWSTMINPNVLSLKAARMWLEFQNEDECTHAVHKLSQINNVRNITLYYGNLISFVFVYRKRETLSAEIKKLESIGTFRQTLFATIKFPECMARLSKNDLRIYESIRNDMQRSQLDVSRESGVSLRTVKRRLQKLTEKNALLFVAGWDPSKIEGVASEINILYPDGRTGRTLTEKITNELQDSILFVESHEEPSAAFVTLSKNVAAAADAAANLRSISGVRSYRLNIIQEIVRVRETLRLGEVG